MNMDEVELYHGVGCDHCNETGFQGRLGVYELLTTTDELRTMLMKGESAAAIRRRARLTGMKTMREDAWRKALSGITTIEEVNRRTRTDVPLSKEQIASVVGA